MAKKTRKTIFLICLLLFVLIAPIAVLYSQGYRIDFNPPDNGKIITQTGGLYFKVVPRQVDIYFDGKLNKKTDFFFGSVLVENLLPKKYKVEVKKQGYYSWQKTLEIKEKQVVEAKNIVLFPQDISFNLLATGKAMPTIEDVNNDIYFLDNSGNLFKNKKQISLTPFPIEPEDQYVLKSFQDFIFLQTENNLYKFNPDLKVFENFFEKIKDLKISQDNKKLVYFSDYEIWLFFLNDKADPPQKKAGEKLFLTRFSEKINDLFWLNSDYLIFNTHDKIKISEIDDRDKLNIIDIFEIKKLPSNGSTTKMFWNQSDKKIYILSDNNLYNSNPLLP